MDDLGNPKSLGAERASSSPTMDRVHRSSPGAADSKSLYYAMVNRAKNYLWQQVLNEEKPHPIGDLVNEEIAHFAASPDGTNFAFIRARWLHDALLIEVLK